jgi:hypothetical protein
MTGCLVRPARCRVAATNLQQDAASRVGVGLARRSIVGNLVWPDAVVDVAEASGLHHQRPVRVNERRNRISRSNIQDGFDTALGARLISTSGVLPPGSAVTAARFARYVLTGSMIMGCSPRYVRVVYLSRRNYVSGVGDALIGLAGIAGRQGPIPAGGRLRAERR